MKYSKDEKEAIPTQRTSKRPLTLRITITSNLKCICNLQNVQQLKETNPLYTISNYNAVTRLTVLKLGQEISHSFSALSLNIRA